MWWSNYSWRSRAGNIKAYQGNNSHLTYLSICHANLQNGGYRVVTGTLRSCRNLQKVTLINCSITDEQLLPIVDAIRGHRMLETLQLYGNDIGNAGCEAIATLLIDPNYNLRYLNLGRNIPLVMRVQLQLQTV